METDRKARVGEALRMLDGLEAVYVEAKSQEIVGLVVMCAVLILRQAVKNGADVDQLAISLATGGLAVTAAALFDTTDDTLQPLAGRYRECSRRDCLAESLPAVDKPSESM